MTADSPHSARLQRRMDGWLEGEEGSNGKKISRGEREKDGKSLPAYQQRSDFAFLGCGGGKEKRSRSQISNFALELTFADVAITPFS